MLEYLYLDLTESLPFDSFGNEVFNERMFIMGQYNVSDFQEWMLKEPTLPF